MANIKTKICDIAFSNPIWTAAGPTAANAEMLKRAAAGGTGALVTKTLSVHPARVPVPNIHTPFPHSLLNAELWSEMPYQNFIDQELPQIKAIGLPVIVSVGYAPEDLKVLGQELARSGLADALEFSIHYVGKDANSLIRIAEALKGEVPVPIFAKLSPSVTDLPTTIQALDDWVDGFVAINSVGPALDFDVETLQPWLGSADGRGWLSGQAILPIGLHFVATIASLTDKPVIGVGGIRSAIDVVKYLMAGASAVQICSLAILKGQEVYGQLANQLSVWMDQHGYSDIESLRGAFLRREPDRRHYLSDAPRLLPQLRPERCNYCNICVRHCVHQAIHFNGNEFIVDPNRCVSCGLCISVCPKKALYLTTRVGRCAADN